MSMEVQVTDLASGVSVGVNRDGALKVGAAQASKTFNATLEVDDTPVEIVPAKGGEIFCITGILLTGNKGISTNTDATVSIYTSTDSASSTAVTTILTTLVAQSSSRDILLGTNFLAAEEGHFINGQTSDDNVVVTVMGFYVKV